MEELTQRECEMLARIAILEASHMHNRIGVVTSAQQKRAYREKKNEWLEIIRKLLMKEDSLPPPPTTTV